MADGMDETPDNKAPEDEVAQDPAGRNGPSDNGAPDQLAFVPVDYPPGVMAVGSSGGKVEEFHRPPTRIERLRSWLEGLPRVRLYVAMLFIVWLSLTLLIGVNVNPFASGGPSLWTAFLGVGIVVATEMWISWYFLERFGKKILRENALISILLAASLLILFTALARIFFLLSLPPYLIPLPGLSILGTILLGPRLMFFMVVITSVNVGIIAGNDFFLASSLLLTSGFAIYTVLRVGPRTELVGAGLLIALVSA